MNYNMQQSPNLRQRQQQNQYDKPIGYDQYNDSYDNYEMMWDSEEDRIMFVRKVYGILSAQLILTSFMCVLPIISESIQLFFVQNPGLALLLGIVAIILSCVLFCCQRVARKVPHNYIIMLAFTFCEAYLVAFLCAMVGDAKIVLTAVFLTAGIVVALTIYALTTKRDFTLCGGAMVILGAIFVMAGLFSMFMGPTFKLLYCCVGVALFGFYLIADTQLIIGGKRLGISQDDYILGAVMLYLDIINIFIYVLTILTTIGDNN